MGCGTSTTSAASHADPVAGSKATSASIVPHDHEENTPSLLRSPTSRLPDPKYQLPPGKTSLFTPPPEQPFCRSRQSSARSQRAVSSLPGTPGNKSLIVRPPSATHSERELAVHLQQRLSPRAMREVYLGDEALEAESGRTSVSSGLTERLINQY